MAQVLFPSGDRQAEQNYIQTNMWQQVVPIQIVLRECGGTKGVLSTPQPGGELSRLCN